MKFQENPPNGSRDTAEKVLPSESSVLNYWRIAPKLASFVGHGWKVRCMSFQGNPSNRSRDTEEKHVVLLVMYA